MTDMFDGFGDSDSMEDNDEEIGALGSILSWDDEDEAGVEASVAATTTALEECEKGAKLPSLKFKDNAFMHQFSGISSDGSTENFAIPMPMPTPVDCTTTTQQKVQEAMQQPVLPKARETQQPQKVVNTGAAQQQPVQNATTQQQQVLDAPAPVVSAAVTQQPPQPQAMNMGAAAANQFPAPPMMFPMFQQPALFNTSNPQQAQAMQYGMAQMMQQQAQAAQQQSQQPSQIQQNEFNKVFFQQMQQAAAQAQQFSMQQSRQMSAQSASMMGGALPPQPIPSMSTGIMPVAPLPKKSTAKRKASPSIQASAAKRRPTVVSSSDTDGDTSGKSMTKSTRYSGKKSDMSSDAITSSGPIDTSHMTAQEKAKANRDRNREHARNTRLRKKAYLEKLKSTVDELCRERDTLVSERAGAATLLVEMHNIRTEVLMSFFALRSANEQRRELWGSILDESFACVMPVTPYRSFLASEVQVSKCQRTVLGIDSMMADTASLHVLLNTLVDRSQFPKASIEFRYTLVTEDVVVAGNQIMARWSMSTVNAVQLGARMEVAKQGMLCAKFNSAHKIIGLELMFDVMAFMLQLKQATGQDSFSVVPNTVQTCQRSFDKPMVMTLAERPYTIVQVNKLWEDMTGYSAEDVVGKTSCRKLQGQETDQKELEKLMNSVRYKRASSGLLVNYNKNGERFRNHLTLYPLSTDSKITHYVALTTHFGPADGTEGSSAAPNGAAVTVPAQQQDPKASLQGQTQLMQSMMLPGPRPAPSLAPLGNSFVIAPTMPHPPLGFFPAPVAVPSAVTKMSMPDTKPAASSTSSCGTKQSGTSTKST